MLDGRQTPLLHILQREFRYVRCERARPVRARADVRSKQASGDVETHWE